MFCWGMSININYPGFFLPKKELYSFKMSQKSTRKVVNCWYPKLFCKASEGEKQCPAQSGHRLVVHFSFCPLIWGFPLPQQEGVMRTGGFNFLNSFRDNVLLTVSVVRNSMHIKTKKKKNRRWPLCSPLLRATSEPCTWITYIHVLFPKTTQYNQHYMTHCCYTNIFDLQNEVKVTFWKRSKTHKKTWGLVSEIWVREEEPLLLKVKTINLHLLPTLSNPSQNYKL